ncbi:MAG TPA: PorP/SprF family type IX secretion system membrane protein [Chitinophagales bacterium]|nr:PorP/SprF family type IX secretion system membrane protein [Chitinophagales bacterium]HNF51862.1 PorP/SprF family type IX secretion system membrane protein [Chitinophagales bacterium]HNG71394.1 PorP/SprF family type IX secretion system membrane protein [Chitinophagales bacterium]
MNLKFKSGLILFGIILIFTFQTNAQDYKFSQFYNSPLNLNPAFTGKINSLYRFVANYRVQYLPLQSPSPYNTLSASADFGVLRDKLKGDIFGVGVVFTNDRQTAIRTNTMMFSLAYHKSLGKQKNHYLSVGAQVGFLQRSVDLGNLAFASQFTGTGFDLSLNNQENFAGEKYFKPNLNIGLFWSSNFTKSIGAYAGVSVFNIIKPKDSFFKSDNERAMRFNTHAGLFIDVKKIVLISPNGMYMYQAKAQQWIAGSSFSFNVSGKSEPYKTAVSLGVWYDGNGAVIASTGVSFLGLQIGFSYDATVKKDLNKAVKSVGALEASIIYTGRPLDKKKSYSPLLCPKF